MADAGPAVRALRAAASRSGEWPKIGEDDVDGQERPRPLSAAGHLLAFPCWKEDRVLVRRNGTTSRGGAREAQTITAGMVEAGPRGK